MTSPLMIEVRDLTHRLQWGTQTLIILEGIRLDVKAGESLALLGASGSGKSTLLGLLAGLDLPSSGSIRLAGQEITTLDEEARAALRARQLGFIFQSFLLLPSFTALENVMLPGELAGLADPEGAARALLAEVGLAQRLDHLPSQLSGGEQQRVAIARAFMGQPALLLADEPTGNLDRQTGQHITDLLFELNRRHGTSLVIVTHDAALAARCGRQLRLAGGRLQAPAL
ncbi:ATP-binding cassette domain-containing protein [Pseudaeromonas sp. ZJS20]|uniref:ABC transporter ATP-binding protein n=1 Tax=Pseudaeromonas aegiceratis TaxID=3153928 RepID=UPI00390C56B3